MTRVEFLMLPYPKKINSLLLTIKEGDGIGADGVQSHHLFTVFGAAAFVFLFPPEKGSAGCCRERFTGIFLHFCHTVSAIKLLVHPVSRRDDRHILSQGEGSEQSLDVVFR